MKPVQRLTFIDGVALRERSPSPRPSAPFVITLCPVPVPISIPRPRSRQLARFSFYSSPRNDGRDDGYWVHMGYFSTRTEAQRWLKVLRKEYPHAFVSEARSPEPARQCAQRPDRLLKTTVSDSSAHVEERSAVTSSSIKSH